MAALSSRPEPEQPLNDWGGKRLGRSTSTGSVWREATGTTRRGHGFERLDREVRGTGKDPGWPCPRRPATAHPGVGVHPELPDWSPSANRGPFRKKITVVA